MRRLIGLISLFLFVATIVTCGRGSSGPAIFSIRSVVAKNDKASTGQSDLLVFVAIANTGGSDGAVDEVGLKFFQSPAPPSAIPGSIEDLIPTLKNRFKFADESADEKYKDISEYFKVSELRITDKILDRDRDPSDEEVTLSSRNVIDLTPEELQSQLEKVSDSDLEGSANPLIIPRKQARTFVFFISIAEDLSAYLTSEGLVLNEVIMGSYVRGHNRTGRTETEVETTSDEIEAATAASILDSIIVQSKAHLNITAVVSDKDVANVGTQGINITMSIENTGGATANLDLATLSFMAFDGTDYTDDFKLTPIACDPFIPGATEQDCSFSVDIADTAIPGTRNILGRVSGKDDNTGDLVEAISDTTDEAAFAVIEVKKRATLVVDSLEPSLTTISKGMSFSLTGKVTNIGTSAALLNESTLAFINTANKSISDGFTISPASDNPKEIAGGTTAIFRYAVATTVDTPSGTADVTLVLTGTDSTDASAVSGKGPANPLSLLIQKPAKLEASWVLPAQIVEGTNEDIKLRITNTGEATAKDVAVGSLAYIQVSSALTLSDITGPSPASTPTILGGTSQDFVYTVKTAGGDAGIFKVSNSATGKDGNSGESLTSTSSTSDNITIQTPAALSITQVKITNDTNYSNVYQGQSGIPISVLISNSGGATATVTALTLKFVNGVAADEAQYYVVSAVSGNPSSVSGNSSATFNYTVNIATNAPTGAKTVDASVTAKDANNVAANDDSATAKYSWTVGVPAAISGAVTLSSATASLGQSITVTYTVTSTGPKAGTNLTPTCTYSGTRGSGSVVPTIVATLTPSSYATIDASGGGNATRAFTFSFTVGANDLSSGEGNITFSCTATATDATYGHTVSASSASSNALTTQSVPVLSVTTVAVTPDKVSRRTDTNEAFAVQVTVTNTGKASANLNDPVLIFTHSTAGTVTAEYSASVSTDFATIGGVGSATASRTFVMSVNVNNGAQTGTITVDASISGTDANSGGAVSDNAATTTDSFILQTPAALTVSAVDFSPASVSQSQTNISATVTVANSGTATANISSTAIKFDQLGVDKTAQYTITASGGNPSSIAGGGNGNFTFTISVSASATTGTITAYGTVSGTDANDAVATSDSDINPTDTFTVTTKAIVAVSTVSITPITVSKGQTGVTVSVTIQNGGGADATSVTPSLTFTQTTANDRSGDYTATCTNCSNADQLTLTPSETDTYTFSVDVKSLDSVAVGVAITVNCNATATESNLGTAISDSDGANTTDLWTVQVPAALAITAVATTPTKVSRGQTSIAVTISVQNSGQEGLTSVSISTATPLFTQSTSNDRDADYTVACSNCDTTTIAGGATQVYNFTVDVAAGATTGSITLNSGTVSAQGANSGTALSDTDGATTTDSWTVQTPAVIRVNSVTTTPTTVSRGQASIAVTIAVENTGQADASSMDIAAADLTLKQGATDRSSEYTLACSNCSGANLTIAGGAINSYTYSVTVGGSATTGATTLDCATIAGTDANSSSAITDNNGATTTDSWTVQTAATLVVGSITFTPTALVQGEPSTGSSLVTVPVQNTGEATANVSSVALVLTKTAVIETTKFTIASVAAPTTIAGAATSNYTFKITPKLAYKESDSSYTTALQGDYTIDATAAGTDANSSSSISDNAAAATDAVTVNYFIADSAKITDNVSASKASWGNYYDSAGETGLDVIIGVTNAADKLYKHIDDGTFSSKFATSDLGTFNTNDVKFFDCDNDGDLDVFFALDSAEDELYKNDGDGTFTQFNDTLETQTTYMAIIADMNLDNYDDIIVMSSGFGSYYYDNSSGTNLTEIHASAGLPTDTTPTFGLALDYTNSSNNGTQDRYLDLFLGGNTMYSNNQNKTFASRTSIGLTSSTTQGSCAGDYDNDGDFDLFVTRSGGASQDLFYENNGNGTFTEKATSIGLTDTSNGNTCTFGDLDNDGDLDLIVANDNNSRTFFYFNDGSKNFKEAGSIITATNDTARNTKWVALGDYDNDGNLDILLVNSGSAIILYENKSVDSNSSNSDHKKWMKVKANLTGGGPAFGAKVQLDQDCDSNFTGSVLTRFIDGSSGNEPVAHFGLSTDNCDRYIRVTFPDGTVVTTVPKAVNQTVTVTDTP